MRLLPVVVSHASVFVPPSGHASGEEEEGVGEGSSIGKERWRKHGGMGRLGPCRTRSHDEKTAWGLQKRFDVPDRADQRFEHSIGWHFGGDRGEGSAEVVD